MNRKIFQKILALIIGIGLLGSDCFGAQSQSHGQSTRATVTCRDCGKAVTGEWRCFRGAHSVSTGSVKCHTCKCKVAICDKCFIARPAQSSSSISGLNPIKITTPVAGSAYTQLTVQIESKEAADGDRGTCAGCGDSVAFGKKLCQTCAGYVQSANSSAGPSVPELVAELIEEHNKNEVMQECDACYRHFDVVLSECPRCYAGGIMQKICRNGVHALPFLGACVLSQHVQRFLPAALRCTPSRGLQGALFGLGCINFMTAGAQRYALGSFVDRMMDYAKTVAYATGGCHASGTHRVLGFSTALCSLAYRLTLRHAPASKPAKFVKKRPMLNSCLSVIF